jgi:DNA-directed RNA polymerase specialized sigma24 family protein
MEDDDKLVELFKKGDISAFDDIYNKYSRLIRCLCEYDADCQQEIWIKIFLNLKKYKNKNFISWIRQLAKRTIIDLNRRKTALKRSIKVNPIEKEYEDFYEQIDFKVLNNMEFEVVFLRLHGKKFSEISELSGINMNSCLTLYRSATKKIKIDFIERDLLEN